MLKNLHLRIKTAASEKHFGEIFKGSTIYFLARISAMLIALISNIIIAHYYGAEIVGVIALLTSYLAFTGIFTTAGLNTALLRLIPEQLTRFSIIEARIVFVKAAKIVLVLGVLASSILWNSVEYITENIYKDPSLSTWFYITTLFILASTLTGLNNTAIRALKKIKVSALLQITQPLINISLLILLTLWFYKPENPLYVMFCSMGLGFIISTIFATRLLPQKKPAVNTKPSSQYGTLDLLSISWPMFLTGTMGLLISQVDIVMLGAFTETRDVGVYAIATKLGMMTYLVLSSINMILAPKISELYYNSDMKSLAQVAKKSSKLIFYTTSPMLVFLVLFGKPILSIFGEEFVMGYTALVFIALGQFINSICGSVGIFLNMTGNQKISNSIMLMAAALNALLNFILIPRYGLEGAAFASFMSTAFWNICCLFIIKIRFGFYIGYLPKARNFIRNFSRSDLNNNSQ